MTHQSWYPRLKVDDADAIDLLGVFRLSSYFHVDSLQHTCLRYVERRLTDTSDQLRLHRSLVALWQLVFVPGVEPSIRTMAVQHTVVSLQLGYLATKKHFQDAQIWDKIDKYGVIEGLVFRERR